MSASPRMRATARGEIRGIKGYETSLWPASRIVCRPFHGLTLFYQTSPWGFASLYPTLADHLLHRFRASLFA